MSLISSFSKFTERIVQTKLSNLFNKYSVIVSEQHGFCKNKLTNTAAYKLLNYVYISLDKKCTLWLFSLI